ncbi:NlpC/P60 family protein [Marinibacterium anthonyi]|nr:NlpC/P60 family protein [Marinibacterium anthonyi]
MTWSDRYIGLPDEACHCWGLVRRVYGAELGIDLPAYAGTVVSAGERAEVDALMRGEEASGLWCDAAGPVRPFDVLVFRRGGYLSHVGLAVDPHRMLHMQGQARIEPFTAGRWAARLRGVYRHLQTPLKWVS